MMYWKKAATSNEADGLLSWSVSKISAIYASPFPGSRARMGAVKRVATASSHVKARLGPRCRASRVKRVKTDSEERARLGS